MLCLDCKHKQICKHYNYVTSNNDIELLVKNCDHYLNKILNHVQSSISNINNTTTTTLNSINTSSEKHYTDFSKMSRENKDIKAIPVEINKKRCDRCKSEVFSTDIQICNECHNNVCSDCGVSMLNDNGNYITICETCWSGEDYTDTNNEDIVLKYSDSQDKEWDINEFIYDKDNEEINNDKDITK